MDRLEEFIWAEKYRPKTVNDTILTPALKIPFQKYVDDGNVPNLILAGTSGIGKTTVAMAMLDEIGADYIVIDGSKDGNIDTLRGLITNFASTVSFTGGRKYVIIDEADYLNPQSTQPALRNFMQKFSVNCGFIFTCNWKNKIITPLHSRCSVVEFKVPNDDKAKIAAQFFKSACAILDNENVPYDKKSVAALVTKHFPDQRRVLNELQHYSTNGAIDEGILASFGAENVTTLIGFLKSKNFTEMRKWVGENADVDSDSLYRAVYDCLPANADSTQSFADAIIILAEYQYKEAFVANSEINRVAALANLMAEVGWK
jgi:DNA polymerase III delta prime subunit